MPENIAQRQTDRHPYYYKVLRPSEREASEQRVEGKEIIKIQRAKNIYREANRRTDRQIDRRTRGREKEEKGEGESKREDEGEGEGR